MLSMGLTRSLWQPKYVNYSVQPMINRNILCLYIYIYIYDLFLTMQSNVNFNIIFIRNGNAALDILIQNSLTFIKDKNALLMHIQVWIITIIP